MYNGIGLQTARGSGTNGYVQRNLSFVKQTKNKIEYRTEEDFKKLEAEINRVPNQEILDHQKKRQIEVKCLEMQELLEEQGYSEEEVLKKVNAFRDALSERIDSSVKKKEWLLETSHTNVKETHQMAEMNQQRNDKLKNALGIGPHFIEGSSLDATRKAKEAMAAEALLRQKKYECIKDSSPEPEVEQSKPQNKSHEKRKKKEKSRKDRSNKKRHSRRDSSESESESDSDSNDSRSNSKRRKKDKSHDKKSKDKRRDKGREHKSRKYSKYSDSSSGSDSETTSGSSSESVSESGSSSSTNSSNYNSKSSRKDKHWSKGRHKYSSSPEMTRKLKSHYDYKGSSFQKDDQKTSYLIDQNIKQVRKENENSAKQEKQRSHQNDEREQTRDSGDEKRKSYESKSRSSSPEPKAKRLKSAVYESDGLKKAKEIPKSYSSNYYEAKSDDKSERSVSPDGKSRHSSRSRHRSRSASLKSNGSRSSNHSSRRSYSSSDVSSRSATRSRSRSPSIPRRKGSPSFLDKRRITSARKRPIPYRRSSPTLSSHSSTYSTRSRSRSRSLSLSSSSSYSYSANASTNI